ncbi:MAG: sigma-70 family RNA polymerase sigma factor [Chitinophagaceae bacterium]|nr:MAG: sigma-70 family RNA polymerase sigma factor [Chitinophagaceae bacterium]
MNLFTKQPPGENELIKGCIAGKRAMQKALYELYSKRMLAVCLRYCKTTFEAEDILQDGFVKVFTKLADFKRDCPLEFWIKRIMINTALKSQRGKITSMTVLGEDPDENVADEEFILSNYAFNELMEMVQSLAPSYQLVFNLHAIEEMTYKEIGEQLGITEGTAKSQYARARAILKKKLEKEKSMYNEKIIR